ncbi:hypothetical protein V2J09_004906 [Rumex salicifolius]
MGNTSIPLASRTILGSLLGKHPWSRHIANRLAVLEVDTEKETRKDNVEVPSMDSGKTIPEKAIGGATPKNLIKSQASTQDRQKGKMRGLGRLLLLSRNPRRLLRRIRPWLIKEQNRGNSPDLVELCLTPTSPSGSTPSSLSAAPTSVSLADDNSTSDIMEDDKEVLGSTHNTQGAGSSGFKRSYRYLLNRHKVDVLVLLEPHVSGNCANEFCAQFDYSEYVHVEALGTSGGI